MIRWRSARSEAPEPETPAPKKRRHPAGSKNRPKPEVALAQPPKPKAKAKVKKARVVEEEEPEQLPPYVQQELPRPPQQDLAAALLGLMQTHERERVGRKRAQYAGWVSRF